MIHVRGELICERIGCFESKEVKDFVRNKQEEKNWPDKNMPIALCPIHALGRTEVLKVKFVNGKILVKTMTTEELKLPPHIEVIQGLYFNKLNNRWIGEYKIKQICDRYWYEQEHSATIETGNGVVSYKKDFEEETKIDKRTKEYKLSHKEEPIIISEAINIYNLEEVKDKFQKAEKLVNDFVKKQAIEVVVETVIFESKLEEPTFTEEQKVAFKEKFDNDKKGIATSIIKELDERKENSEDISDIELPEWIQKSIDPVKEKAIDEKISNENKEIEKPPIKIKFIPPFEAKEKVNNQFSLADIDEKTFVNSPSVMFLLETHESLEIIISDFLKKWGCDFDRLKNERPIIKDSLDDEIWYEEYAAIVCHLLFCHLPIYAKIEWISTFLNRSLKEVNCLLGIHYNRFFNFKKQSNLNDLYPDCYLDLSWKIAEYFSRYYKYEHSYKYWEDKK